MVRAIGAWMAVGLLLAACGSSSSDGDEGDGKGGAGGGIGGGGGAGGDGGGGPEARCVDLRPDASCTAREDCAVSGGRCVAAADAPCGDLSEAQCGGRDECAARLDVFGEFSECRALAAVPCGDLDEGRCGRRDDCAWDGAACAAPPPACEDHATETACANAECHWWQDACHDAAEPAPCSHADQATCEADTACRWTNERCRVKPAEPPVCDVLAEGACNARPDCRWNGRACEVDPAQVPCGALDAAACAGRFQCAWDPVGAVCIDRPSGQCGALAEQDCRARPDCAPRYEPPTGGCDACSGDDSENCECEPRFARCGPRLVDCGNVPANACAATPGCHLEQTGSCDPGGPCDCDPANPDCQCGALEGECVTICVNDDPNGCGLRQAAQCEADALCELHERQVCEGDAAVPGDAPGFAIPDPPVCHVESSCLPARS
jgi:hypothetical protein